MSSLDGDFFRRYFTDLGGRFHGRLSAVVPTFASFSGESKFAGISARYECRVKVEYQKDLMGLLEEGMLLAVRNFKRVDGDGVRFTLMEVSRVWPEHFGLRGLSDHSYYPMQFEIIEQSETDWGTDDKATMIIQISAIPINYDLILLEGADPSFEKGFSYPVLAGEAYILNSDMINRMYNQRVAEKFSIDTNKSVEDARSDPRLGVIKMFQSSRVRIPLYVDFESLVRYHFGIFAFTGGGKSNLLSNILRRIIYHSDETKVVIFDISCEYPFLLMDVLADPDIDSRVVLEHRVDSVEQFYNSIVKPREYESDARVLEGLRRIMDLGRVSYYTKPRFRVPTYGQFLEELEGLRKESVNRPHYINAIEEIREVILDYLDQKGYVESQEVDEEFVELVDYTASSIVKKFKVHEASGLFAWATTRSAVLEMLRRRGEGETGESRGLTAEGLRRLIGGGMRLLCLSIADPVTIKDLVIRLTSELLSGRKRRFQIKPYVLFVFDEAQEFIPDISGSSGIDKQCSRHVETLLRQGRKYGLGGCVATQRIAYLNTNALQQLHTYFVGTLPRPYDRSVVSDTFMINQGILEKTLEFAPGEWLLSSYIATGIENVPIFIKADNAEKEVEEYLNTVSS